MRQPNNFPFKEPLRVAVDVPTTRRYRLNIVIDADGAVVFTAPRLLAVLRWLQEYEMDQVLLIDDHGRFKIKFDKSTD